MFTYFESSLSRTNSDLTKSELNVLRETLQDHTKNCLRFRLSAAYYELGKSEKRLVDIGCRKFMEIR